MKNELRISKAIRTHLDEGSERLSFKQQLRLDQARKAALSARLASQTVTTSTTAISSATNQGSALALSSGPGKNAGSKWSNWLGAIIPALVLAIGLYGIERVTLTEEAELLATEDIMLLTDELPPSVYADNGFGVFIKNTRVAESEFMSGLGVQ